jgi:hypothetical protein
MTLGIVSERDGGAVPIGGLVGQNQGTVSVSHATASTAHL